MCTIILARIACEVNEICNTHTQWHTCCFSRQWQDESMIWISTKPDTYWWLCQCAPWTWPWTNHRPGLRLTARGRAVLMHMQPRLFCLLALKISYLALQNSWSRLITLSQRKMDGTIRFPMYEWRLGKNASPELAGIAELREFEEFFHPFHPLSFGISIFHYFCELNQILHFNIMQKTLKLVGLLSFAVKLERCMTPKIKPFFSKFARP